MYTTRGNRSHLNLPRMRTDAGRKSFRYQRALIFNSLPKYEVSILRFFNITILKTKKNHVKSVMTNVDKSFVYILNCYICEIRYTK